MPVYVDSAAAGLDNGTSWTDAYTSLASTTGVAAGTEIWIASGTAQDFAATISLDWTNGTAASPVVLISVNKSDDTYLAGASFTVGSTTARDVTLNGYIRVSGVSFESSRAIYLAQTRSRQEYTDCTWKWYTGSGATTNVKIHVGGTSIAASSTVTFRGCTADFRNTATATAAFLPRGTSVMQWFNGTVLPRAAGQTNLTEMLSSSSATYAEFRAVDLTSMPTSLTTWVGGMNRVTLMGCNIPSGFAPAGTPSENGEFVEIMNSANGTITTPTVGTSRYTFFGTQTTSTTEYRTGGATDGIRANPYSWSLSSNANTVKMHGPLESFPLTVAVAANASPSGATAKSLRQRTRKTLRATAAALTTDGDSTWTGTGVGTKQKISVTVGDYTLTLFFASGATLYNDEFWIEVFAPDQVGGPITVRCYLAKASTTVYIDPQIVIDGSGGGNEFFSNGVQVTQAAAAGGSGGFIIGG